jgi:hypothetical protein
MVAPVWPKLAEHGAGRRECVRFWPLVPRRRTVGRRDKPSVFAYHCVNPSLDHYSHDKQNC